MDNMNANEAPNAVMHTVAPSEMDSPASGNAGVREMRANVYRFVISNPGDVGGLANAITEGTIEAAKIVAIIGKTHGNGLVNDYTRGYLTLALSSLIAERIGSTPDAVKERIPFIFSGGVEGVLTPHFTVFTVEESDLPAVNAQPALAIGVAFSPSLGPGDIGRESQIAATADAVGRAMARAKINNPAGVHFVQVKCPAFPVEALQENDARKAPITDNPSKLMAFGRSASALGVARALGEWPHDRLGEEAVLRDFETFSSVASVSAGIEISAIEVVVLGMSEHWSGKHAIDHEILQDALDIAGFHNLANRLGLLQAPHMQRAEIKAGFVKCEADRRGTIRGRPHTMLNDGDIDQQRHIRCAVGAIASAVLNETALFVSGGAEQQGPDGGGLVAVIVERPAAH